MLHSRVLSAFAALVSLSCAAALPAAAADLTDGDYRDDSVTPRHERHNDNDADGGRRHGYWGQHYIPRVAARASYSNDSLPFYVKERRARISAVEAWTSKVSNRYGHRYASWRAATDKQVSCEGAAGSIYCTVSARPGRAWPRWGWYGARRIGY